MSLHNAIAHVFMNTNKAVTDQPAGFFPRGRAHCLRDDWKRKLLCLFLLGTFCVEEGHMHPTNNANTAIAPMF